MIELTNNIRNIQKSLKPVVFATECDYNLHHFIQIMHTIWSLKRNHVDVVVVIVSTSKNKCANCDAILHNNNYNLYAFISIKLVFLGFAVFFISFFFFKNISMKSALCFKFGFSSRCSFRRLHLILAAANCTHKQCCTWHSCVHLGFTGGIIASCALFLFHFCVSCGNFQ